jgi:hypothetical protein
MQGFVGIAYGAEKAERGADRDLVFRGNFVVCLMERGGTHLDILYLEMLMANAV